MELSSVTDASPSPYKRQQQSARPAPLPPAGARPYPAPADGKKPSGSLKCYFCRVLPLTFH